ncbi:FG-GAP-like repeat-containing protein [Streptomyces xanthophaeus]
MKHTAALALALLTTTGTLGLGLTATPAVAAPRPAPPLVKIMPLGDSITEGAGSTTGGGYRAPLWDLISGQGRYTPDFVGSLSSGSVADPDNEGHSGYTIKDIRAGIDPWQAAADPDVVLLHLGINDLNTHHADPRTAAAELLSLIDRLHTNDPAVTVIVLGLLTDTRGQSERTNAFNSSLRDAVTARSDTGRHLLYVEPPRLNAATELPDGLHPSDLGYPKLAAAYRDGLERAVTNGWTHRPPAPRAGTEAGGTGRVRWADFDGDGRPDHLTIADNGRVDVLLNRGGDPAGTNGWQRLGPVATGVTTDRSRVRFADWDGDAKADYILLNPSGDVTVYLNRGGDTGGGWDRLDHVARGTTTDHNQVRLADWDGDGRTDYLTIADNGAVKAWLNRGGDGRGGWNELGQIATGTTTDRTRVRLADHDGDGRTDYWTVNPDGTLTTYLNQGGDKHGGWKGLIQSTTRFSSDPNKAHLVDFNADTRADCLVTSPLGNTTAHLNDGNTTSGLDGWTPAGTVIGSTTP